MKVLSARLTRVAILLCALPTLVVGMTTAPSVAAPSELDSYTKGACGAVIPGAYVEVYTHWVNDDRGSKVTFVGNASGAVKKCSTGAVMAYQVKLNWTVIAKGYSVDSCSASSDGIFGCSASSSQQTWSYSTSTSSGYRRVEVPSSYGLYFSDGFPGDIGQVCSYAEAWVVYNNIERPTKTGRCNDA